MNNTLGFSFQPLVGDINLLVRGGSDHHKYGDPYTFSMVIECCWDVAFPQGACAEETLPAGWADKVQDQLLAEYPHIHRAKWERLRDSGVFVPREMGVKCQ